MRLTPRHVLIFSAVALIAIAIILTQTTIRGKPGSVAREGNLITRVMSGVGANSSTDYQLRLLEGNDAEHESAHIFQVIRDIQGIARATLNTDSVVLTVTYDSSIVPESLIRSALVSSGYLVLGPGDATPMELSEDSTVQRLEIVDDEGFQPSHIRAKAGVPLELVFGPGTACRTIVKFPQLGVVEDITEGATVLLPALEPGQYDIFCGGDDSEGTITVE